MRRLLVLSLAAALVLAGCGDGEGDGASDLDEITVSKDKAPRVKVADDFTVGSTETKVLADGGGDTISSGDTVKINYLAVNGRTGKEFDSTYSSGRPTIITLDEGSILPGFIKSLEGKKVGSRILAAVTPKDGFGESRSELDLEADDTIVFVFDLVAKVPDEATGQKVDAPKDLPELALKDGKPSAFEPTDDTGPAPTTPRAEVLVQGTGPTVQEGQTISVQYLGQVYPDGEVFDSSWQRGTPSTFQLVEGQLIDCWTDLLAGQKVGSRVMLVCPSDSAYGDEGREPQIKGGDTLLFSIDLLDAS